MLSKVLENISRMAPFRKREKSINPYPKMSSPEKKAACDQVQCVILDVMIQEEQKKLTEDQDSYQALLVQRQGDRQQLKKPQKT